MKNLFLLTLVLLTVASQTLDMREQMIKRAILEKILELEGI